MRRRYAPDMDAEDSFGLSQEVLDEILATYDEDGYHEALDMASSEHDMSSDDLDDLLEWFGR